MRRARDLDPDADLCPACGGCRWRYLDESSSTGVSHPDTGEEERWWARGYLCLDCGHFDAEPPQRVFRPSHHSGRPPRP